jgi:2-iminobutanoate/2-iminopropanoate deaminase
MSDADALAELNQREGGKRSRARRRFLCATLAALALPDLLAACAGPEQRPPTNPENSNMPQNSNTSERKRIVSASAPAALGPYSQAIVAGGLAYCSGQIALDPKSGNMISGDVSTQTERVLENLKAVLAAAGSDLGRVVKCTVYLKSIDDFSAMNTVYGKYFSGSEPPARATVEVARLPKGALVEIDCTALV